jgi:hypothetical protein
VRQSVTFANVNGIEFENSHHVRALANEAYDNVVGILVVLLSGLDEKTSSDVLVSGNKVHDNNHVNFAPPGDLAAFVPTGSGILVVGVDRVKVAKNRVTGNQFVGIGVASTLVLAELAGLDPSAFGDIEPNPDFDRIADNVVTGNGSAASPIPFLPAVDLLWIPAGRGIVGAGTRSGPASPLRCRPVASAAWSFHVPAGGARSGGATRKTRRTVQFHCASRCPSR